MHVRGFDHVSLPTNDVEALIEFYKRLDFPILYEDEWLLAMDKPSGMAVHTGSGITGDEIEVVLPFEASLRTDVEILDIARFLPLPHGRREIDRRSFRPRLDPGDQALLPVEPLKLPGPEPDEHRTADRGGEKDTPYGLPRCVDLGSLCHDSRPSRA